MLMMTRLREDQIVAIVAAKRFASTNKHQLKAKEMAHLSDYDTKKQYFAVIKSTRRLSPDDSEEVREIIFEVKKPGFTCEIDQSFGVLVRKSDEFGNTLHHRLYSIADLPAKNKGKTQITMLIKRCNYIDEFSGELQYGIASNFLCDRKVGDEIIITGPYPLAFSIPKEHHANLILIGMGTGIAPFRAFIKHIYTHVKDWSGRILLFYGARSGLELLYQNEEDDDLTNYYSKDTFKAIHAFSPRPLWNDPVVLDQAIEDRSEEILEMLRLQDTYVYVAGHEKVKQGLDKAFEKVIGSAEEWKKRKTVLENEGKWVELIY